MAFLTGNLVPNTQSLLTELQNASGLPESVIYYAVNQAVALPTLLGPGSLQKVLMNPGSSSRSAQYILNKYSSTKPVKATTFVFPVSPQNSKIERNSLVNWFETQASSNPSARLSQDITRIIDAYGLTPPIFTVSGTTGYNKYQADNFQKTGTAWTTALKKFFSDWYDNLQLTGQPETMQFLDFFQHEFWNVVPVGPLVLNQASTQPLWVFYNFSLAAISPISATPVNVTGLSMQSNFFTPPSTTTFMGGLQSLLGGI